MGRGVFRRVGDMLFNPHSFGDEDLEIRATQVGKNSVHVKGTCHAAQGDLPCELEVREIDGVLTENWGDQSNQNAMVNVACQKKMREIALELYKTKREG